MKSATYNNQNVIIYKANKTMFNIVFIYVVNYLFFSL